MTERPRIEEVDVDVVDVVIAGAGPAGLCAGLYTARYGLRTLILHRGKSLLEQCAYLDNYLGFPGGLTAAEFLDAARAQVADAGAELVSDAIVTVVTVDCGGSGGGDDDRPAGFVVHTRRGTAARANAFIAATGRDAGYLERLGRGAPTCLVDDDGELRSDLIDRRGRTPIPGLYIAGSLAGCEDQAIISAGHGADVALGLIQDLRLAGGLWPALARHLDWQVKRGTYDSDRWAARVHAYFDATVPRDRPLDADRVRQLIQSWIDAKRAGQLDRLEIERRRQQGLVRRAVVSGDPTGRPSRPAPVARRRATQP